MVERFPCKEKVVGSNPAKGFIVNSKVKIYKQKFTGCGSIYFVNRKNQPENWSKQYGWAVHNHKDCLMLLEKLKNKLIIKKKKCEEAIKFIKSKRWHREYLSKKELEKLKHLSYRKIAKQLGASHMAVFNYLRKYGLK